MAGTDHIPSTKACKACGEHKPLTSEYWTPQKLGKYGFMSRCRECRKIECAKLRARPGQKARQQAWRDANKGYIKAYNKKYREDGYSSTAAAREWYWRNLEEARRRSRESARKLRAKYPEKYRVIARRHWEKHRDRILQRANERSARLYRQEPWFNLKVKVSSRMRFMLAGCGGKSRERTEALLGYSLNELVAHIERQFTKGMSWDKVLSGEIHIDHIIPVVAFKASSPDDPEFKACWALSNLRPMWAIENKRKRHAITTLL